MLKSLNKHNLILIGVLIANFAFAQSRYSNDLYYLTSKYENAFNLSNPYQIAYPDTSVKNIHNYASRNFLGNIGLPQPDYIMRPVSEPLGFNLYKLPYAMNMFTEKKVEYYRTKGPFASLTGIAGSKNDQMFKLLFSHTIKKKLNITLKFDRYGCTGYYLKQQTFTNNFFMSTNYSNKSNRYGFFGYLLIDKMKHQENGGIKYDTMFTDYPLINKQLLPVNLNYAKRDTRLVTTSFNPWVKLNKSNDSTGYSHYIDYKFKYKGNYYWYTDGGGKPEGNYADWYLDSTKTNDSTHLSQFTNQINYTFKINKPGIGLNAGYSKEHSILHQHNDTVFTNDIAYASLFINKFLLNKDSSRILANKRIYSNFSYSNILRGPNKTDYKLEWTTKLDFGLNEKGLATKRTNSVYLNFLLEQRHPDFIYNYWHINNYQWENSFKPVKYWQGNMGVRNYVSGLSFNVLWHNYFNYLYFDSVANPKQLKTIISNWQYNINFDKVLFKHLGIRANVFYQTTNNKKIIKMPGLTGMGALYYTGNLFKNALQLQVGVQGEYYQAFQANAYNPALNQFYIQTKDTVGNYPFVDVFLCARIKPVQFFVKVENVLYGLMGSNYSMVPGYIQPDRSFRFGITWLFFD
jgi:hypothetical protein